MSTGFIRSRRRARQTGTTVLVLDTEAEDADIYPEGDLRWATLCEPHGGIVYHDTLALARDWASDPTGWCPVCQDHTEALAMNLQRSQS